jgi:Tol biopolymer transport system component
VIRTPVRLMLYVLFLIAILAGCAKTTQIIPLPLPPTDTQLPATKTLPPPTDTPAIPTQTLEPFPTASSINGMPMTERVSIASDGTQGNSDSNLPALSADGRYVVFSSNASNLVEGDTNRDTDIFVHDRKTGETIRVSISGDGTQGNSDSNGPSISADGRYVAFRSNASNLVEGDTNGVQDVFVHDRMTGETTRVSVASDGTQANNASASFTCLCAYSELFISADGRYVTFSSVASNLVESDSNEVADIFVHDRMTGETTRVSVASDGTQTNSDSYGAVISADGLYVAFDSSTSNLLVRDNNEFENVFVHDRLSGETNRISVSSDGVKGNSASTGPSISADGRYVAFASFSNDLVKGDTNNVCDIIGDGTYDENCEDVFVHDRKTGETIRVSVSSDGTQFNSGSNNAVISADGRYVTFTSGGSYLGKGDTIPYGVWDIFVHDMKTGQTQLVSIASDGTMGNGYSYLSSISADGRYVTFASVANNLVEGDTNGSYDIFVRDFGASK